MSAEPRRIAIVHQGDPSDSRAWSGIPYGLSSGLRELGHEVVSVNVDVPGAARLAGLLRLAWYWQLTNPVVAALSSAIADRAIRRAGALDGLVTIGSGYLVATAAPIVTFEDMTVAQLMREPGVMDGLGLRAIRRWRQRQLLSYDRAVSCCVASRWAADSLRDDYEVPDAKIRVTGLGCNTRAAAVARDWSVPRFLFIGVDWERKRGGDVLAAFAAVRQRHRAARLDLVGGHPPLEAEGVTGHGPLPLDSEQGQRKLDELLESATCLVMPSQIEPFGIAHLDAARAGVASIGTTAGGAPDAIGGGGRLVAPGDRAALEAAMEELANPEAARILGERAFAHSANFTWAKVAERVLAALLPAAPGGAQAV